MNVLYLRAEGSSCSLCVLYGGLGITKLQFFIKKYPIKFFPIFGHQNLDPDSDPYPDPNSLNPDPQLCLCPVGIEECVERSRKKRGGRGGLPAWRDSNDSDNTDQGDGGSGVSIRIPSLTPIRMRRNKDGGGGRTQSTSELTRGPPELVQHFLL
jgi:hypothetical protein